MSAPEHRYRKRPVEITAVQYLGNNSEEVCRILGMEHGKHAKWTPTGGMLIQTLEGEMLARVDDWIIKGVKGEFYPCKPDIFEATYTASSPQESYKLAEELERRCQELAQAHPHHVNGPIHNIAALVMTHRDAILAALRSSTSEQDARFEWMLHNAGLLNEWAAKEWRPDIHGPLISWLRSKALAAIAALRSSPSEDWVPARYNRHNELLDLIAKWMSAPVNQCEQGEIRPTGDALDAMESFGGSFVRALAHCYMMADPGNKQALARSGVNRWFDEYNRKAAAAIAASGGAKGDGNG